MFMKGKIHKNHGGGTLERMVFLGKLCPSLVREVEKVLSI